MEDRKFSSLSKLEASSSFSFSETSMDVEDPENRPVSPQNGFEIRMKRDENQNSDSMMSSVSTVVQSQRRVLAPKHRSPLQPTRLFDLNCDPSTSPTLSDPQSNRRGSPRKVRIPSHLIKLASFSSSEDLEGLESATRRPDCSRINLASRPWRDDFMNFTSIGRGAFGKVFRCVRKLDLRSYALKEITSSFRTKSERERALQEIHALATQGDNVHVVRYYNAWEENGKLFILTELCSGTLSHVRKELGPLTEGMLQNALIQISRGLDYLHNSWKIAHLDIKPENLYTTHNGLFKLGDLGLARKADRRDLAEEGDKRYLSREMIQHENCDLYKVDMFALGISFFELASPTPLPADGDAYHALREDQAPPLDKISRPLEELILSLMSSDPQSRPSSKDLCESEILQSKASFFCLECECDGRSPMVNTLRFPTDQEELTNRVKKNEKEVENLTSEIQTIHAESKRLEALMKKRPADS